MLSPMKNVITSVVKLGPKYFLMFFFKFVQVGVERSLKKQKLHDQYDNIRKEKAAENDLWDKKLFSTQNYS